jgi:hypothetical protein
MQNSRMSPTQKLLLTAHLLSGLAYLFFTASSLWRLLEAGELPEQPIIGGAGSHSFPQPPPQPQRRTGYFDRAGGL